MPRNEIEEFAEVITQQVRDAVIRAVDARLRVNAQDPVTKRWRRIFRDEELKSIAEAVLPDIVDETIFCLLRTIDQNSLKLSFEASSGRSMKLPVDGRGELGGSYMASPGWRAKYAKERFVDDLADLLE